ncbi:MAG: hypothetical protein RLZZ618_2036 [Pseudomonadota bacterium]|jgi:type IV fimbrial biogenesis protein FimT
MFALHPPAHRCLGFTLIEACATVAVLAVLITLVAPSLRQALDTRRLDGVATQFAADLAFARSQAQARNMPVHLRFSSGPSGASCYAVQASVGAPAECPCVPGAVCVQSLRFVALGPADGVQLSSSAASMRLDPRHGTNTPTSTIRVSSRDGRSVVQAVNLMGRVRSCSPEARVPGYPAC